MKARNEVEGNTYESNRQQRLFISWNRLHRAGGQLAYLRAGGASVSVKLSCILDKEGFQ